MTYYTNIQAKHLKLQEQLNEIHIAITELESLGIHEANINLQKANHKTITQRLNSAIDLSKEIESRKIDQNTIGLWETLGSEIQPLQAQIKQCKMVIAELKSINEGV